MGTLAVRRSTLLLKVSTAETVRAPKEKAGSGDFEGWAAAAILTQRAAAERQTNHEVPAVLYYTAATVEAISFNNSTHRDVQPTIALSAVLCCRYTVRASDQPSKQSLLRRRPWNTVVMFLLLLLGLFLVVGQRTAGDDARKCRSQGDWFQRITNL